MNKPIKKEKCSKHQVVHKNGGYPSCSPQVPKEKGGRNCGVLIDAQEGNYCSNVMPCERHLKSNQEQIRSSLEEEKRKPVWHLKVENGIRYFHPSYRQLSESEIKNVPKEFWYPDPIHQSSLAPKEVEKWEKNIISKYFVYRMDKDHVGAEKELIEDIRSLLADSKREIEKKAVQYMNEVDYENFLIELNPINKHE